MASQLLLFKRELIEDDYFADPSQWTAGTDWYVFLNSNPGAVQVAAPALGSALVLNDTPLEYQKQYQYTIRIDNSNNTGSAFLLIGGTTAAVLTSAGPFPVILQGLVTTTAIDNSVVLYADNGNTTVISKLSLIEVPTSVVMDLTSDIDVPVTYSIADIRDPSKRNTAYSKTITIPGSKVNNIYFNHIFEISGDSTFNPNRKVRALVYEEGVETFNGVAQLKTITRVRGGLNDYDSINYEVVLLGKLADLFYNVGDKLLSDLNFAEFDHDYTLTNQNNSWSTSIIKNASPYVNTNNGANLTISSVQNSSGRAQVNFSGAHGLVAGDWLLIPEGSITAGSNFYLGEHEVYSITSSTSAVLRCPYSTIGGNILTTTSGAHGSVRKHTKKGEGYVYPMCNYGESNGVDWNVKNFYPAIYVKQYVDKIFQDSGFIYDSNFFNSTMFKKMIIPFNGKELKLTFEQIQAKLFRASSTNNSSITYNISPSYDQSGAHGNNRYKGHAIQGFGVGPAFTPFNNGPATILHVAIDDDTTLPNSDPGGNFNTGTYRWTCPNSGNYDLFFQGLLGHYYTLPGGVFQVNRSDTNSPPGNFFTLSGQITYQIFNYTTLQIVTTSTFGVNPSLSVSPSVLNFFCTTGHVYGVRVITNSPIKGQFYTVSTNPAISDHYTGNITCTTIMYANAVFRNNVQNTALGEGDTLLMNMCVPQKIKQADFLTSLIKMFNLYVEVDKSNDRKLYIEPRNDFYALGATLDWTPKLNIDQQLTISPMGELNAKSYTYSYSNDPSVVGKDHLDKYGLTYGNKIYTIEENDFVNGVNDTKVIFASTTLHEVNIGQGTGRIISDTTGEALRILYFNLTGTENIIAANNWVHVQFSGGVTRNIFPYAGHLDKVEAPNYDLNWDYPRGTYFDYDSWTNRNLFNVYWRQFIEEITDRESKIVTCYLHLTALDIFKLDFRNIYVIDGHYLRLNKITDFAVGQNVPTLCEFIKIKAKKPFVPSLYSTVAIDTNPYDPQGRAVNGEGLPEIAFASNDTNSNAMYSSIQVQGSGNTFNPLGSSVVSVNGNNNTIGSNVSNIIVQGNNNNIQPGLSNVALYNTSNVNVTESDTVYINGIKINSSGALINTNINVIDAGTDQVLNPFNEASVVNLINASEDTIMELGSFDLRNDVDAGEDDIL